MTLYRASGAAESKRHLEGKSRPPKPERSTRFLKEALPLLRELADAGLASVTHSLLQTLEFFIPVDPAEVFVCIGQVVLAGKNAGYQYESLAADLIVKLIGRYLAEYSELLRDNSACRRALVEILDVFVTAGWPSAQRLAYRLEEIFQMIRTRNANEALPSSKARTSYEERIKPHCRYSETLCCLEPERGCGRILGAHIMYTL